MTHELGAQAGLGYLLLLAFAVAAVTTVAFYRFAIGVGVPWFFAVPASAFAFMSCYLFGDSAVNALSREWLGKSLEPGPQWALGFLAFGLAIAVAVTGVAARRWLDAQRLEQ